MKSVPQNGRTLSLGVCTIFLLSIADLFFYRAPVGFTGGVFGLLLTGVLVFRKRSRLSEQVVLIIVCLLAALCISLLYEARIIPSFLVLCGLLVLSLGNRFGWSNDLSVWKHRLLGLLRKAPLQASRDIYRIIKRATPVTLYHRVKNALGGWFWPILFTAGFAVLFTAANPIFLKVANESIVQCTYLLKQLFSALSPSRLVFWTLVGSFIWALLRAKSHSLHPKTQKGQSESPITISTVVRSLWLFNILFFLQGLSDSLYLLGGKALPEGMTYAQYAHRGAYPLIATALLAALFVLVSFRPGGIAEKSITARRLVYAWITQNVFLVFTSVMRLIFYIEVFGLSRWRLSALAWMSLVAVGLLLILFRIFNELENSWLIRANFISLLGLLLPSSATTFDDKIAWYNVSHARTIESIGRPILDVSYLESLGHETLPALRWYARCGQNAQFRAKANSAAITLRHDLEQTLSHWQGRTLHRSYTLEHDVRMEAKRYQEDCE